MATSLFLAATDPRIEAVYTWFEQHQGPQAQIWGYENQRRAALLAYSDGPGDDFGWSNWASKADDPSRALSLFERIELITEDEQATALNATFSGAFALATATSFG